MWKSKKEKAEKYELVLPHRGGVILGVFRPKRWMSATSVNFPDHAEMIRKYLESGKGERLGFEGVEETDPQMVQLYSHKRVPDRNRTAPQQPCRYVDHVIDLKDCALESAAFIVPDHKVWRASKIRP